MKSLDSKKWKKSLLALSAIALFGFAGTNSAQAGYGAFVSSTGAGSFGAYGLSWNWRTPRAAVNSAVSTARYHNGGYLNGHRFNWWGHRGFEAGARGFNWDASFVSFGWARGWRTRGGALNYAIGRLGWNTYDLGYVSGFNR